MKFYLRFINDIILTLIFTTLYSVSNIAVLMYINEKILTLTSQDGKSILIFGLLLFLFLFFAVISRAVITIIGHRFVYNVRLKIVKDILNAKFESIEKIGKSRLLASLSSDISGLSLGFGAIPEALQGIFVLVFTLGYIIYLSFSIGIFVIIWLAFMIIISLYSMKKTYFYFNQHRSGEDVLYKNYSECIEGFREFSINFQRSQKFLQNKFIPNVKNMRSNIVRANIHLAFVSNFLSAMMLGVIGLIFYSALAYNITAISTAITIAIAILFIRSPLIMAISALPSVQKARIALNRLNNLNLEQIKSTSQTNNDVELDKFKNWKEIRLENVSFEYENGFKLQNINMSINRGEKLFITGANGGGKSTLFLILCGLLTPKSGNILIDGIKINNSNIDLYKKNISVVFSDFYLFDEFLSDDIDMVDSLLRKFFLDDKVGINGKKFTTKELSTGQKKRLALIISILDNTNLLFLDEWAADQDPKFRALFYSEILPYINSLGITVVLISHDDRFFNCADRIYAMNNGNIKLISDCKNSLN